MQFENGIELSDVDEGLLVSQFDDAYIARGWRLTAPTIELVETALASGLRWMIRKGHPQPHARWPSRKGRVYLAFSPTRENQWSLAIDTYRDGRGDYGVGVFNGKYHEQFLEHQVPFEFEKRNRGAGHMVVAREHILPTLKLLGDLDHNVLFLGRDSQTADGFQTEYDIQRAILFEWKKTPFSERHRIIGDEFPVDPGVNPRRIDVLARDMASGDWLVIEVKRAEAKIAAVQQIEDYLGTIGRRDDFAYGKLTGALVAERVPPAVRHYAASQGIEAYEASYPFALRQVA
ncbi:endonuclease NucS domain-containing protein [Fodinicurvata halophila]|uniref:Endonuclease NucS domain-containing protein n=1 Tax=Fodinicurvata halophila TaxID=1419723 RepID=A0ABV8ULY9_9PROT